jgi:hypothetical protein
MGEKIVVGPINKGLKNDRTAFVIDNDSFPMLFNAYQWRGRVKRKRGTSTLGRLTRFFNSTSPSYNTGSTTITLDGSGNGNLITGFGLNTVTPNATIVPKTNGFYAAVITAPGPTTFTDNGDGTLTPSGTINYSTGAITIAAAAGLAVSATFFYFPDLPVMGLRDLNLLSTQFPGTLGFDTKYSYDIQVFSPYGVYDVSFYKNPPAAASLPGYVQKTTVTPTTWNGQNYQQFWTVNYQGALWATNGINVPFSTTNIGMQYNTITAIAIVAAGPPAIATITTTTNHGLSIGDFVFINEVGGITGINFQTGYVTAVPAVNQITVEFPNATLGGVYTSGGIVQYLTNRSDKTKDCLRWYDGDPTNGSATSPALSGNLGWVNFAPPLSQRVYSIADTPQAQYYLVGAKMIVPFKDRLLFFGPVIQTSAANSQIFLQDTVIYSQSGTPYYTASFTNTPSATVDNPTSVTTTYNPILVPTSQTATPSAYFEDSTGFGGFISAGISQTINTVSTNEDALIVGFDRSQTKLIYSGNDVVPFNFFIINSEYGAGSTFSTINMDKGVITTGKRGITITSQVETRRIDLDIPDQIFEFSNINNGLERVCAQRDFISEWIYFTYVDDKDNSDIYVYPNQTLQYNYRDDSWGIFDETYTTYGTFRQQTGDTWANIGLRYATWRDWDVPWEDGISSNLLQPLVIAGNQQGFVIIRNIGTGEGSSLYIQNLSNGTVTCPDHGLNLGDYIVISGVLGTEGTVVNGQIFSVANPVTQNSFLLNPLPSDSGLTYLGGGLIQRMYVPFIQSKQFPPSWGMARKTRIGVQQYLLTGTSNSQIQLLIFLSQNGTDAYNQGPIVPAVNSENNSLVYSTILYTCPESTNLGLTAANTNLQMLTAQSQQQIWHRMNTSLIGDTVQVGFTMSDEQMRDINFTNQFSEIELHGFIIDVTPSMVLA